MLFSKSTNKKIKGATIAQAIFLMLAPMLIGLFLSFQIQGVSCRSRVFSFVQIGDTQWANETQLESIVNFVVGNKTVLDIQYVVHMGDIVNDYDDETDWETKDIAFSQLTNFVPFGWLAGDQDGESQWYLGDNYYAFNVSNYPNMTSSYDQGRSTAQYFNFSSAEILFVNLEYFANVTALQWFESLYQHYDKAIVIFSTHSYLDFNGNYTKDTINPTYLDAYPRVKLVLCGHIPYALNQNVNGRHEIRFNYQRVPNYVPDLSDFIRVYTVFDDGTVDAWTYSQLRDQFLTDPANQFSFYLFSPPNPSPTPAEPTSNPSPTIPQPTTTPSPDPSPIVPEPTTTPFSNPFLNPLSTPDPTSISSSQPEPVLIITVAIFASAFTLTLCCLFYFKKRKS